MHRLKATILFLAAFALSLSAHANNASKIEKTTPEKTDSTTTVEQHKLVTFGLFSLKAVNKEAILREVEKELLQPKPQ